MECVIRNASKFVKLNPVMNHVSVSRLLKKNIVVDIHVCPELCRFCDKEKFKELIDYHLTLFEDYVYEENDRFIELKECHHIFEVKLFDKYLAIKYEENSTDMTVQLPRCPRCRSLI